MVGGVRDRWVQCVHDVTRLVAAGWCRQAGWTGKRYQRISIWYPTGRTLPLEWIYVVVFPLFKLIVGYSIDGSIKYSHSGTARSLRG
jgi:hypothetical protein